MYRCQNCGSRFDEPNFIEYYAENFYGVGSWFDSKNTIIVRECPRCGSDDIEEICDEYDE